jgi:hypothetical protein
MTISASQQAQYYAVGVYNGPIPKEGPKAVPIAADFSVLPSYDIDFTLLQQKGWVTQFQVVYIDNSLQTLPVILTVNGSNQKIQIAGGMQGTFPIFCPNPAKFNVQSNGGKLVNLQFLNVPVTCMQWSATANSLTFDGNGNALVSDAALDGLIASGNGALPVQETLANAPTSGSGTITTGGTSQQLFAGNPTRRGFMVQNPLTATESLWINELGAAATAAEPSIEVKAGTILSSADLGYTTFAAINIIGATSAHAFTARQW